MAGWIRVIWILGFLFFVVAAVYAGDGAQGSAGSGPPKAEVRPLAEDLHGTKIVDPYRWLEDGKSADTQKWVGEEMAYTRTVLDPLPGRDAIHKRLAELLSVGSIGVPRMAGKYYFYTRREGMQNQPVLYVREGIDGKDRALVDVNQLSADGTIALDWFYPSEHGKYVAYGTSPSGTEMSTLHIVETKTGNSLPDTIERTRGVSMAWSHDNSGFYYTRYPKKGDVAEGQEVYNRHVFYHLLGTDPTTDPPIFGEGRDPEDWPEVSLDNDGRMLLITESQGWTKTELFLMDLKKGTLPTRITTGKNFIYSGTVYNGRIYIVTNEDAPRFRVFMAEAGNYERDDWKEIIPQTGGVLKDAELWGGKIFAQYEENATSQLKVFDLGGSLLSNLKLPAIGSIFAAQGKWDRDEIFYGFESFTIPRSIYRYDLETRDTKLWAKVDAPAIDPTAYEVQQEWYQSKDGTRVPMFLVHKKGLKKDGDNPTLLTGYGGFNVSLTPEFDSDIYLWLEHGGIYAVANLRGGAEFGEDWHRAGMLDKKQNVFDDMIRAAEYLISEKYTSANRLAIKGGSNGGLLMGAMITQRPDLFRAVVCQVPLLDMLRYEQIAAGSSWVAEYGSVSVPAERAFLASISPYNNLRAGVKYPEALIWSTTKDDRVGPQHARKFAAKLASMDVPYLYFEVIEGGHGAGATPDERAKMHAREYTYFSSKLGL